jgi:hypothetical protein
MFIVELLIFDNGNQVAYALFGGGQSSSVSSTKVNTTTKYQYSDDTISSGSVLGLARADFAAAGNLDFAYFRGGRTNAGGSAGFGTSYSERYTYANGGVVNTTALTTARSTHSATGSSILGIFAQGYNTSAQVQSSTERIIYASASHASGTALTTAKAAASASGNEVKGVFAAGITSVIILTVNEYNFSTGVTGGGTNFGVVRSVAAGLGIDEYGIHGGGANGAGVPLGTTEKYTYAGSGRAPGTALPVLRSYLAGTGSTVFGVFAGGYAGTIGTSPTSTVSKYIYSGASTRAGTSLSANRVAMASPGSTPAAFACRNC